MGGETKDGKSRIAGDASTASYYSAIVEHPLSGRPSYEAECLDVIEALQMTFAEGEAFKALWRLAASRQGRGKPGNTRLYDAQKAQFYAGRVLEREQRIEGKKLRGLV